MKLLQKFFKNNEKLNANEIAICTDKTNNKYKKLDEYLKNINNYSTDETIVGEWFGKPLYRKVIETTLNSTVNSWKNLTKGLNADNIIKYYGNFVLSNEQKILPYIGQSGSSIVSVWFQKGTNNELQEAHNSSIFNGCSAKIVIEYTKTTD